MDPLLDLLERGSGARDKDHVRSGVGERLGSGGADPARRAGDERELAGEWFRIGHGSALVEPPVHRKSESRSSKTLCARTHVSGTARSGDRGSTDALESGPADLRPDDDRD